VQRGKRFTMGPSALAYVSGADFPLMYGGMPISNPLASFAAGECSSSQTSLGYFGQLLVTNIGTRSADNGRRERINR
jgi:hypothetical protein